jgi:hypothetical protein
MSNIMQQPSQTGLQHNLIDLRLKFVVRPSLPILEEFFMARTPENSFYEPASRCITPSEGRIEIVPRRDTRMK